MSNFVRFLRCGWILAILLLATGRVTAEEAGEEMAKDEPTSVAIYPLKATGVKENLASALTQVLASELSESPRIKLIQESYIQTIMKQQEINISDMYDSTKFQVDLGRLVAAQKILAGEITLLSGKFQFSLNLIDVEKGTTDLAQTELCPCTEEQLVDLVREMALKIRIHFGEELTPPPDSQAEPSVPQEPVEALGPVSILDKPLKKKITIEASKASRTATGTVQVQIVVKNKSKARLSLQARSQFFDKDRFPIESSTAWQRLFVSPKSIATYSEMSTRRDVKYYQVEIREAR